jgi:hypothetical protein
MSASLRLHIPELEMYRFKRISSGFEGLLGDLGALGASLAASGFVANFEGAFLTGAFPLELLAFLYPPCLAEPGRLLSLS